jgi:hypothetical protein
MLYYRYKALIKVRRHYTRLTGELSYELAPTTTSTKSCSSLAISAL